ncbi:HlyD family efflux transporter periplasmic adaptor subunit [Synechococcus sp. AH-601-P18]|nr:HlyD family efflux transporter periplasmic adaptor subunit [Synechococcus sp. AH-601-P18]
MLAQGVVALCPPKVYYGGMTGSNRKTSLVGPEAEQELNENVVDTIATTEDLSLKEKAGDAANRWLDKNRSLVLRQTPVWAQSLVLLLIILGVTSVTAAIIFRIDEVVTASGQLKSIGGTVEVKTPAGGKVAEVFFADGDTIKQGQKLLRFDTRQALQDKMTYTKLIDLENKQLLTQLQALESQEKTLSGRKDVLMKQLRTKEFILQEMKKLVAQGGFQRIQYLQKQDEVYALQTQATNIDEELNRLNLQAEATKLQSNKSIDQMKNTLQRAMLQLQYQNVISPVDGIVFDPQASPQGVLSSGERILSIVPQKGLFAEVYIPNKDIGFVKKGQDAKVRVNSFPFTRYGELSGKISQIGADALPPDSTNNSYRYPVKIQLESSYLESDDVKIPLLSGMAITTNLKLRDKPVISLISDMFVDQTDSIRGIRQQ